jgi:uncharacterized protein (DUF1800 family)
MNSHILRLFRDLPGSIRTALLALPTLILPVSLSAAIDYGLNGDLWRMRYGVTAAQLGNPTWLAADDDMDGISNGSELAAGTNPFLPGSTIRIASATPNGVNIDLSFPTVLGKQYVAQRSPSLTSPTWTALGTPVTGDGTTKTIPVSKFAGSFYRVLVQDIDTDNDQVSDWAERVAGYDPNSGNTQGSPTDDHTALVGAVASSNVVTVVATEVTATQPPNAATAPIDTGRIAVRRSGPLLFNSITVPLQKTGTAAEGTDYDALPASVTFPADAAEVILAINPKANAARKTNVTAIVKALAGLNYTLGGTTSGSVVIFPAGTTNGTGLTARYHNTSDSNYTNQTTIFNGSAELSRTDATVDFSSGVNGWGSTAGPTGLSPASTNNAFSVRWTGQILPQYSETYFIDFRSDDSAKVWVNGRLLVDRWTTQAATDYINTIDLQAGVLYDIQIDYWNNAASTTAEAKLYWYSASQVRQIIPQNRLFPAPTLASKVTAVTSPIEVVGYEGTPLSFSITNPSIGGAVTYALDPNSASLPPGLTLNGTTGVVSGTPTLAGTYNVAVNATNTAAGVTTGSSVVNFIIYPVGGLSREVLTATGSTVASIVQPSGDPGHTTIATADDDADHGTNTGKRLRGYFVPPKTGNYYFWIAANNAAELWISNDDEYVNRVRRALVAPSGTGKKTWNAQAGQRSPWLYFIGGQKYYFEVLHNSGADADDHVAVGWCQDDLGAAPAVAGSANPNGTPSQIPNGGAALQGYALSGTMPGYVFQPFDYPTAVASSGTLYACNLGPQGSAATTASGSSSLRVNAAGTQAILKFDYQGLGSAKTAYHLHVDGFDSHPQGEIVFDIDDIDAFHPELRPNPGEYIWNIVPGGTFPTAASIVDAIQRGKVYLNIHSVLYPAGEIRGTFGLVDGSQSPPDPAAYVDPGYPDDHATDAGAARFLNQATFGASPADIAYVKANGFAAWIANQLTQPNSSTSGDVVALLTADVNNPYPTANFVNTWWKKAITGPDQLRQRLAFALSQILVVSYQNDTGPLARNGRVLADYCDNLIDNCLPTPGLSGSGNFLGLLKAVTLTPAMGLYLDMRANNKADLTIGRHPNENYAREILQLFSVGLYARWDDGRLKLDAKANLIPTYGQPEILGFSATFTGWNYAQSLQSNGRLPTNFGPGADYLNPMVLVPNNHERAAKLLLDRVVLPAATGQTPRVNVASVTVASPANINTATQHGLKVGDTVHIAGVSGGTYSSPAAINGAHIVTAIVDADTFRVGINCTGAPTANTGTVTGATVIAATSATSGGVTTSGLTPITGSQADSAGSTLPHPYDQYGLNELTKSHENIVNNDSVAPYICRQLIQRLVKSHPSPGYLYRVVQKFRDNGSGVRGDLAAVVTQILLDGEARNSAAAFSSTAHGKQREPLLRVTGPARAFPALPYTGTYTQLTGTAANRLRIVTSTPNDFNAAFNVSLDFRGNYVPAGQTLTPYNNPTSTAYSIISTLGIAGVAVGNPATVTTQSDHGLTTGDSVTISGVTGGTTSPTINGTYPVTVTGPATFTVPVNCTTATNANTGTIVGANTLTVAATGIATANYSQAAGSNTLTVSMAGPPTNVTVLGSNTTAAFTAPATLANPTTLTATGHGLVTGDVVLIAGITNGTFSPTINGNQTVTVIDANTFTVPVNCTVANTVLGTFRRTAKSRVHLTFLSQTAAGGAAFPATQIYDVQTNGANLFTITTADTPATARSGLLMAPRIAASYTVQSSTVVRLNTNVNHNLQVGNNVWIDSPVQGGAPVDGQFNVIGMTDEDHFTVTYPPVYPVPNGTYSNPSGSQNGVTIWPLVPPPAGRSGVVTVNSSTFACNGTNGSLSQTPFNAPTVFNFFYPDYKYPGSLANNNIDSPEFQLSNDTDIANLTNSLTNMFIGTGGGNGNLNGLSSFNNGGGAIVFDIGEFMTPAQTSDAAIPALIDKIADRLVGGPLTPAVKTAIQNLVANSTNFPYTTPTNQQMRDRVRAIIHQITVSSEYAVQK